MKILFLSRDYPPRHVGGVGTYVFEMSRVLAKYGHQVFVITEAIDTPLDYVDQGVRVFRVQPGEIRWLNSWRKKFPGLISRLEYSVAVSKKIKELVTRYSIDIVESCEARAEGFWFYLFRNKPALVIKLHTPEGLVYKLNREEYSRDRFWVEKLEEWWILKAKRLVGLSEAITRLTSDHYKMKFKDIPIVPNPIDISSFKCIPSDKSENIVLYAGRLEFRKGVHVLVRAIPLVLSEMPNVKFVFVGDDCGMKDYMLKKLQEFNVTSNVMFVEQLPREQLLEWYQRCALCVVPSLWENHPYVILEAMSCGRPVVTTNVGGLPEIVRHGHNGLLVEAGSVVELAVAIKELLSNRTRCEELGVSARKTMETRYVPEEVMRKTLAIYEEMKAR